ncbi:MAG: PEP-utilizing enzyme [Candidatus Woesearchaeota archaeon]
MIQVKTEINKEEFKEVKKSAENTTFYRQATASKVLYISTAAIGALHEMIPHKTFFCFSKEFEGYYELKGMNSDAKKYVDSCGKSTKLIYDYYNEFKKRLNKLNEQLRASEKVDFGKKSLEELQKIIGGVDELNYELWLNSFLVDKFDPQGDDLLKEKLKEFNLTPEEINVLIRVEKLNFVEESNLELHKIALKYKEKEFSDNDLLGELKKFLKSYYYIQNSWNLAVTIKEEDILGTLQDILKRSKEEIEKVICKYENHGQEIRKKVKGIFKKYNLPKELENLFNLYKILALIRDERKETVLICTHVYEQAAQRFAKEFSVDVELFRNALPLELANITKEHFADLLEKLTERSKSALMGISNNNDFIISKRESAEVIKILHDKLLQDAEQIKGKVACKSLGKVRGKVKIILGETHFTKFEEGDILVAAMTRPEYVPLMKKAKAIITDEGGVTCHAAVASRELNVPCIIGTKIATKKLFDGREVIIDTETGTITPVTEIDINENNVNMNDNEGNKNNTLKEDDKVWILEDKRTEASPFPLIFNIESACGKDSPAQKYLGCNISGMLITFEGDLWSFYEKKGTLKEMGEVLSERIKKEPQFIEKTLEETYRLGNELLKLTHEMSITNLSNKSNLELWNYYSKYRKMINEVRGPAWLAPGLDTSGVFTIILDEILKSKNGNVNHFAALTNPEKRTKGKQQDIELLKIALEVKGDPRLAELFGSSSNIILKGLKNFPKLKKKLEELLSKYCWLPCTYENKPHDMKHYVEVVAELIKSDPRKELTEIKVKEEKNLEEKEKTRKELKLSREEKRLFDTASEMIFFKADRKDIFFQSYYEMRPLIKEIGKRVELSAKDTMYLLPDEVKAALLENKVDKKEVSRRREYCLIFCDNGPITILSGNEAKKYMKNNVKEEIIEQVDELKGSCANTGYAKGRAKLILAPKDMVKMNQGDILIANATNPDIVPAMKKAAAIVTNSGGITCHAAIVSRELGIPAVIGTKVATEVIKDNDLIEVDADKGIVRKIKE